MNWSQSDSPWARAMRRRARSESIQAVISVLAAGVGISIAWQIAKVLGWSNASVITILCGTVVFWSTFAIWSVLRRRAELALARLVPSHDAQVCPRCRKAVEPSPGDSRCPKCARTYSPAQLLEYWERYALTPGTARFPGKTHNDDAPRNPTETQGRWRHIRYLGLLAAVVVALISLNMLWAGESLIVAAVHMVPYLLYGVCFGQGFRLLHEYRQRSGESRHCARCDYEKGPSGPSGESIVRCPECGAEWNQPGGTVHGRRTRRPWQLWTALSMFLFVGLTLGMAIWPGSAQGGWAARFIPTSSLIHDAVHSRYSQTEYWAELCKRSLTPEQNLRLAEGLIDRRLGEAYLSSDVGVWLWTTVQAGGLPPELVQRYYAESFSARIEGPPAARVGEEFRVRLGTEYASSNAPIGADELVFVGGFQVGSAPQPIERQDRAHYASLLDDPEYAVSADVTASRPGPLRVRLHLWYVIGVKLGHKIAWNEDGTPSIPPGAVWSEHRVLEHTVDVGD